MQIYQITKIGEYHFDFCEDYAFFERFSDNKLLCAVMDGCTMGKESYFASTLLGKIIKKIIKERDYKAFLGEITKDISLKQEIKEILFEVFASLQNIKNSLLLEKNELLTTLVMFLADTNTKTGIIIAVGDATIAINGKITRFEQDNQPDYLIYHLGENIEEWFLRQKQIIEIENCQDVSISTDGIDSFQKMDLTENLEQLDIPAYLLNDKTFLEKKEMLNIKVKSLENNYLLKATDDLGIIRVVL